MTSGGRLQQYDTLTSQRSRLCFYRNHEAVAAFIVLLELGVRREVTR